MKSIDKATLPRFFFPSLQENGVYILYLPNSHREGSRMVRLECCLALGSSCRRNPGHSFLWRLTKKNQCQIAVCQGKERRRHLEWSLDSSWFLCFPLSSLFSLGFFHVWFHPLFLTLGPGPHRNVCGLGIFQWFCICIYFPCRCDYSRKVF